MEKPPLVYRLIVNPLRRWIEDRGVPEAGLVDQWRALWRRERKPIPFRNLQLVRAVRRRAA